MKSEATKQEESEKAATEAALAVMQRGKMIQLLRHIRNLIIIFGIALLVLGGERVFGHDQQSGWESIPYEILLYLQITS